MLILHGTWLPNIRLFAIWAETAWAKSAEPAESAESAVRDGVHPFSADAAALLRSVDRFAPGAEPGGQTLIVWLPTSSARPQPSPQARATGHKSPRGKLALRPWQVYALTLRPTDALDVLFGLSASQAAPTNADSAVVAGGDLQFWQEAARAALNCLLVGSYTPELEPNGKLARWRPHIDPALMTTLAQAMPSLCRAITPTLADAPTAEVALRGFLSAAVDGFVQRTMSSFPTQAVFHPLLKALSRRPKLSDPYGTLPPDATTREGPLFAANQFGKFGRSWAGRAWMALLQPESYESPEKIDSGDGGDTADIIDADLGYHLSRGRRHARRGLVQQIEISAGLVRAQVLAAKTDIQQVEIGMQTFDDEEWSAALDALASLAPRLLEGTVPPEAEAALQRAGLSLFARDRADIRFDCSCLRIREDDVDICEHAAAVYFLLAERIDADPFVLFHMRGRTRAQLAELLRHRQDSRSAETGESTTAKLASGLSTFWGVDSATQAHVTRFTPGGEIQSSDVSGLGQIHATVRDAALHILRKMVEN